MFDTDVIGSGSIQRSDNRAALLHALCRPFKRQMQLHVLEGPPMSSTMTAPFVSNKANQRNKSFPLPARIGFDTIRIAGPARPRRRRGDVSTYLDLETAEITSSKSMSTLPSSARFVARHKGDADDVALEGEVPRLRGAATNLYTGNLEDAWDAAEVMYTEAAEYIDWEVPLEEMSLRRIDVVVDFQGVDDIPRILGGLRGVLPKNNSSEHRGKVGSVVAAHRSYAPMSAYGKEQQLLAMAGQHRDLDTVSEIWADAEAAKGVLRVELRLRSDYLRPRLNMRTLMDLDERVLTQTFAARFASYKFDTILDSRSELLRRIAESGLTPTRQAGLLRYVEFTQAGIPTDLSGPTKRKYVRLAHDLGLSALGEGRACRLDLPTASLVYLN